MIIEGDCKSQYPAAVYSPSEQGARPDQYPSPCFCGPPLPSAHHPRREGSCAATGDIHYGPARRLGGPATLGRACLAGLVQIQQGLHFSDGPRDITSRRTVDGVFWVIFFDKAAEISPALGGCLFRQSTFMFKVLSPFVRLQPFGV